MAKETDKPLGAYPNLVMHKKGYVFPNPEGTISADKEISLDDYQELNEEIASVKNLRFLGGCCRIFPKHIERLAQISAKLT